MHSHRTNTNSVLICLCSRPMMPQTKAFYMPSCHTRRNLLLITTRTKSSRECQSHSSANGSKWGFCSYRYHLLRELKTTHSPLVVILYILMWLFSESFTLRWFEGRNAVTSPLYVLLRTGDCTGFSHFLANNCNCMVLCTLLEQMVEIP